MAGLLDLNDPQTQGLLSLGLRLMSTPGPFGQAIGKAGLGAMNDMQATQQQADAKKLRDLQMQQAQMALADAQRKQAEQEAQRQWMQTLPSPQAQASQAALAGGGGPTIANAAKMQPVDPQHQMLFEAMQKGVLPLPSYLDATRKDTTPIAVKAGEALVDRRTFKPLFSQPDKTTIPSALQEYQFAVGQGYKGTYDQWDMERKKAGASNVNVKVGDSIAKEIGPMAKESFDAARGAQQQVVNADNLIKAADAGKLIAGPGATLRLKGAQVGQMLGVGGANEAEVIANTRAAIQGLAQSTLAARAQLKGQGQVSDYEGKLIQAATSGGIDDLTIPEIKQLAMVNKRLAQQVISSHKQFNDKLKANSQTSALSNMFDLPTYDGVRKYNTETGRIE
jgi:hypothetical protein